MWTNKILNIRTNSPPSRHRLLQPLSTAVKSAIAVNSISTDDVVFGRRLAMCDFAQQQQKCGGGSVAVCSDDDAKLQTASIQHSRRRQQHPLLTRSNSNLLLLKKMAKHLLLPLPAAVHLHPVERRRLALLVSFFNVRYRRQLQRSRS